MSAEDGEIPTRVLGRMGKALRDGYRERAFHMSKIDGWDRRSAARSPSRLRYLHR